MSGWLYRCLELGIDGWCVLIDKRAHVLLVPLPELWLVRCLSGHLMLAISRITGVQRWAGNVLSISRSLSLFAFARSLTRRSISQGAAVCKDAEDKPEVAATTSSGVWTASCSQEERCNSIISFLLLFLFLFMNGLGVSAYVLVWRGLSLCQSSFNHPNLHHPLKHNQFHHKSRKQV